jgi:hypothetical protein
VLAMSSPSRRLRRSRERQRRAPTVVAYDKSAFTSAEEALRAAARAQGCTCNVQITLGNNGHAHAQHDDWCALLRREDVN